MAKRKQTKQDEATPTFEDRLGRLEAIVERLESGEAGLDESLALYAEGAALVKACRTVLEEAEQKITTLTEEAGRLKETPLEAPAADADEA